MDTPSRHRPTPAFLIMIAAMLGVICAMVSSALEPTTYRATATAFVGPAGVTAVPDLRGSEAFAAQAADSYADVAKAPIVLDGVVQRLGLTTTAAALAERIVVDRPADSSVLRVSAADSDPARAAAIANAVAQGVVRLAPTLQPASGTKPSTRVTVVRVAAAPHDASGLALPLVVLIGLGTGGGISAAVLLVARLVRRRPPPGTGALAMS